MGGKRLKRGEKGIAAQYVTRAKAIRLLQISLKDFRRLCILKGIYPREPAKTPKQGKGHTYYHKKDVLFLANEPLLRKFREYKIFLRKYKRARNRREYHDAEVIMKKLKPKMVLDHLIRERFPSFIDAIRDLDDALTMLNLFAHLPSGTVDSHNADRSQICLRLVREFNNFVVQSHCLKYAFVSIKGTYFQAEIMNQKVTWIVPHKFTQNLPSDVDFKVMLTFLDFYETAVKFVNFKLYHDLSLVYPPTINLDRDINGLGLSAVMNKRVMSQDEQQEIDEVKQDIQEFAKVSGASLDVGASASEKLLFAGLKFFLGREVPQENLEFVILSLGGEAILENFSQQSTAVQDSTITHHVLDRPLHAGLQKMNREYIQPQWVYDCCNAGALLPIAPYAAGVTPLPPHLSPFVDYDRTGYVPKQKEILDQWVKQSNSSAAAAADSKSDETAGDENEVTMTEDDAESVYVKELNEELRAATGQEIDDDEEEEEHDEAHLDRDESSDDDDQMQDEKKKKKNVSVKKQVMEEDDGVDPQKELAKTMMTKKAYWLYSKMMHGIKRKNKANELLMAKRQRLEQEQQ